MMDDKDRIKIELDEAETGGYAKIKKELRLLSFSLDTEHYCVNIKEIKEVVKISQFTRVPNTPEFIIGIMNLHGEIISLIDIRYFFGLKRKEITKNTMVIVTDVKDGLIGILVDGVEEILNIEESLIQPPITTIREELTVFTRGQICLNNEIFVLLDLKKLLECEEIERLR